MKGQPQPALDKPVGGLPVKKAHPVLSDIVAVTVGMTLESVFQKMSFYCRAFAFPCAGSSACPCSVTGTARIWKEGLGVPGAALLWMLC